MPHVHSHHLILPDVGGAGKPGAAQPVDSQPIVTSPFASMKASGVTMMPGQAHIYASRWYAALDK
jgi:hypothetical protein